MRRVIVNDRFDGFKFELAEADVFEMVRTERVNGEHSLSITTTQVMEQGDRILMEDDLGYWHEWVVFGVDEAHQSGDRPIGSYYSVWSLQHDLMGTRVSAMPGVQTPVTAAQALDSVLSGTSRWERGTVHNTATGGASMYDTDGWSAMSILIENWGGEIDSYIEMDYYPDSIGRYVVYHTQQGEQTAKRRFDFGADLKSVRRTLPDGPLYCRVTPRGRGEESGEGYGRKITIESVNGGLDYLTNSATVDISKLPDGNGGWEYPTIEIENSDIADPAELKDWALSVLEDYTTPKATYTVDVLQLAMEGVSVHGVSLGDAVQVVDGKLHGLRISARVLAMTINELAHTPTTLTIGHVNAGLPDMVMSLSNSIQDVQQSVNNLGQSLSTADYIESLLDRINAEVNATGGYTYIVPGNGILTYDTAVADPLNPVEASQVVEVKGGTIRIANTRTSQGEWEWKTVFVSGHILAELVTAVQIVSGTIGNSNGDFFIDMDNAVFRMPAMTVLGDYTAEQLQDMAQTENANMLDDTNAPSLSKVKADYDRYIESTNDSGYTSTYGALPFDGPAHGIDYCQHLVKTSGTHFHSVSFYNGGNVPAKPGKTYTMSVWAKNRYGTAGIEVLQQYAYSVNGSWSYPNKRTELPSDTDWHRIAYTFTIPSTADDTGIKAYPGGIGSTTGDVYFCGWMLQEGSVLTGWTQSLSDTNFPNAMIRPYSSGVLVCRQGNTIGALVNANGSFDVVAVTWSGNTPTAGTVFASFGTTTIIGKANGGRTVITDSQIDMYVSLNYTEYNRLRIGGTYNELTVGTRISGSTVGTDSVVLGIGSEATKQGAAAIGNTVHAKGDYSCALNNNTTASGTNSLASGSNNTASGSYSAAFGRSNTVSGSDSAVFGYNNKATGNDQLVVGLWNVANTSKRFIVGSGTGDTSRVNAMMVDSYGNTAIAGTLTQNSDRRLKTHIAHLGKEAIAFIRRLKPAVFVKNGGRHYGFYAQDVQMADPWDTRTVESQHSDESVDFDPLTLDYSALIAPLVTYAQSLEQRIDELERRLNGAD